MTHAIGDRVSPSCEARKDPYVIMLTARKAEIDRIIGFSTGADDYIPKPFSPQELVVRLRAVMRRSLRHQDSSFDTIQTPHFTLDPEHREVLIQRANGELAQITLTTVEFDILYKMASHLRRVWTRTELLDAVRGVDYAGDERSIDAYIKRLRRKISSPDEREQFIKTHVNLGYSFEDC
jgi:DNA-binding response OmpR family regulator